MISKQNEWMFSNFPLSFNEHVVASQWLVIVYIVEQTNNLRAERTRLVIERMLIYTLKEE